MKNLHGAVTIGLREKETNKVIAIYPYTPDENDSDKDIEDKVKFWFYQQSCSAEEKLKECYVDVIEQSELAH